MTTSNTGALPIVVLPGSWWFRTSQECVSPLVAKIVAGMLGGLGEASISRFVPSYGTAKTVRARARNALDHLYDQYPQAREKDILFPAIAWSAGAQIARLMEQMHGRRLWSAVGFIAGLPRTGVSYANIVGVTWARPRMVFGGFFRNAMQLTWECISDDVLGSEIALQQDSAVIRLQIWEEQSPEMAWYIAQMFIPGIKELSAPPPLQGPVAVLLFADDVFVAPNTEYKGEDVVHRFVRPGPHGAFLANSQLVDHVVLTVIQQHCTITQIPKQGC